MARLLLLTHEFSPFRGGIATVAHGLGAGAAAHGHDAHLLAPDYGGDRAAADRDRPYTVHRFPGDTCSVLSMDGLTRFALRVRRAAHRLAPDLVHAVDPPSQMALTLLSRFGLAGDYGFTVHGTELLRYRSETLPRLWMWGAFRRPAGIAVVSRAVGSLLLERTDVEPRRVCVAYPGIAPAWHERPPADRRRVRAGRGIRADDVVFVTVARRVPEKGQLRALEALSELPARLRRRVVYVVVGSGPEAYARALERAATDGGVRLRLTGPLDEDAAIDAIDAADVFVMLSERTPTRLEGLGLAYLEAAARGVPSLGRDTGGVREAVLDGETGVVLSRDAGLRAVTTALTGLAADRERRDRMGRAARSHAARFTFERHAAETFGPILARLGTS